MRGTAKCVLPSVAVAENRQDLLERFVLRLGYLLIREYPKDGEEHAER